MHLGELENEQFFFETQQLFPRFIATLHSFLYREYFILHFCAYLLSKISYTRIRSEDRYRTLLSG